MKIKNTLVLFIFTGFFTLGEIQKATARAEPATPHNLTEQNIQNNPQRAKDIETEQNIQNNLQRAKDIETEQNIQNNLQKAKDIEEVRRHIMELCREEYLTQDSAVSFEEKTEDMLDCLSLRTQQWLRPLHQQEESFVKRLKIYFQAVGSQYSGAVEFDTVVPIAGTAGHSSLFLQPGFILSIKDAGDPKNIFSGSFGAVYRFVFYRGVLGFNVFYDRQRGLSSGSAYQHRLGFGSDYQSGRNMFSLNHYQPLQGWKDFNEFYEERARQGIDFSWRRLFSKRLSGHGRVSYWDADKGQEEFSSSVGLDYKLTCASSLGLEAERDFDSNETHTRLTYNILLGAPAHQHGKDCLREQYESETKGLLYRPVQREKKIRVERRRKPPALIIPEQYIFKGEYFSYHISRANFRSVKAGETPDISVSSLPSWISYDKNSMRLSGSTLKIGIWTVRGKIVLPGGNSNLWSFRIIVSDNSVPALLAEDQTFPRGHRLSYQPVIKNMPDDEAISVTVNKISTHSPSVLWLNDRRQFAIDSEEAAVGEYTVTGSIEDEAGQASRWAFLMTVTSTDLSDFVEFSIEDNQAPLLSARDQTLRQREIRRIQPVISRLRLGEKFKVTVDAVSIHSPSVTYSAVNNQFEINAVAARLGVYVVTGSISDENGHSSNWSFKVTVIGENDLYPKNTAGEDNSDEDNRDEDNSDEDNSDEDNNNEDNRDEDNSDEDNNDGDNADTSAPVLLAQDQTILLGSRLNYAPIIDNLRYGENFMVHVQSLSAGAPAVSWDGANNKFLINAEKAGLGTYTVIGSIRDENNNSSNWSFKVTVVSEIVIQPPTDDPKAVIENPIIDPPQDDPLSDNPPQDDNTAPTLTAQSQTVKIGHSLNYAPAIGNIRSGEGYTVTVNAVPSGAPAVSWDGANSEFLINAKKAVVGIYTVIGSIRDENNDSSNWSFKVTVVPRTIIIRPPRDTIDAIKKPIVVDPPQDDPPQDDPPQDDPPQDDPPQDDPPSDDNQAPTLTAQNQTVEIGGSLNYAPAIDNIRSGEGYTVTVNAVPNGAPAVSWDGANARFKVNAGSASLGTYSITGSITDASNNSNAWSFNITVADSRAPTLTAQNQTVEIGGSLNYAPAIGNIRSGEGYTVTVNAVPNGAPAVSWDGANARFKVNAGSANLGTYSITGSITDASNNSNAWSFNITVADSRAPTLTAQNQTVEISEAIASTPVIGNLRSGEAYTVTVRSVTPSSQKPAVSWDSSRKRFSITGGDSPGIYTVSGVIQDASNNSSSWSFTVTVTALADTSAPTLTAQNQTVEIGGSLNYAPAIGNFRSGEAYTVTVSAVPSGAPAVSWDGANAWFKVNAGSASLGTYSITGSITDASNNSNAWSFNITVTDSRSPILRTQSQTVEIGGSLNYAPTIDNIRSGEGYTVTVNAVPNGAPAVSWDGANARFKVNAGSASLGTYSITGSIRDASRNSNPWSLYITVADTRAPTLTAQSRTVEISEAIASTPAIGNLRSGEAYTVTVSSVTPSSQKPAVSWDSSRKRFSITGGDSPGIYTVSGAITDASNNSSSWSFTVTVTSVSIPTLMVSNQAMGIQKKIYHSPYSIGGVRADQSFTVTIDSVSPSAQAPEVSWDAANKRFVIRSTSKVGVYTARGKIRKGRNFSSWSFTITVTLNL